MYIFNSRKMINFSLLTFVIVLIIFVSMFSGVLNSSAHSNDSESNAAATFIVNNNGDTSDLNTADGLCLDANGNCTLRAAIEQANALAGDDVITFDLPLPIRITLLTLNPALSITSNISIIGQGARNTIIDRIQVGQSLQSNFIIGTSGESITTVNMQGITIAKGAARQGTSTGGAITNRTTSNLTLNDVVVDQNSSSFTGGGIYNFGTLNISNSTFSNNYSGSNGAAIFNLGISNIYNSTFSNNYGPTTLDNLGTLSLNNVTIAFNRGAGSLGDNFPSPGLRSGNGAFTYVRNTLVANNSRIPTYADVSGVSTSLGNNFIAANPDGSGFVNGVNGDQTGSTTPPFIPIDARIGTLQNNGGQTDTVALLAESPAINAGNNTNAPPTDQRGFARIVGGIIDIGAFEVQTVTCDFTINPTNQAIGSSGGNVTVNITGVNGCTRTAVSNANWITVTSGSSGSGSGMVTLSVQANTGSARTGTVTIAGQTFTVTQASGCTFTLSPTSATVSGFASTGSFNITASSSDCSYSAVSNNSFITINSGASGNGTISFSIAANPGAARTGTITVGGQTFTISQATIPRLSINSVSLNEGNSGTTAFDFTVNLSSSSAQTVSVNYATTDGTATAPSDYQAKNGSLSFAPGETSKTITILVNGDLEIEPDETFTINLTNEINATIANGIGTGTILNDDFCSYVISPANLSIGAAGGNNSITVTTQAGCTYTAGTSDSFISIIGGANGNGNGTVSFSVAANSGAARSGRIFIAGQVVTITQAAAEVAVGKTRFDFDGDGKADISVYRPDNGVWYLLQSQNGFTGAQFGISTDKIVPADYDGDGKTDLAVYRNGTWYLNRSTAGFTGFAFGAPDDIPQPADFDGDGKAELAVWRPSNGTWYVFNLANNQFTFAQFGASTDKPVVGDYNGDNKADYAVYRPSNGTWYIAKPTGIPAQNFDTIRFGEAADTPVAADYDGDGKTDVAVFRPSNGTWYLLRSRDGFTGAQFGISTDLPAAADYDGDGKADIAVFRSGVWYLQRTTAGFTGVQFGAATDKPVPNAFVP